MSLFEQLLDFAPLASQLRKLQIAHDQQPRELQSHLRQLRQRTELRNRFIEFLLFEQPRRQTEPCRKRHRVRLEHSPIRPQFQLSIPRRRVTLSQREIRSLHQSGRVGRDPPCLFQGLNRLRPLLLGHQHAALQKHPQRVRSRRSRQLVDRPARLLEAALFDRHVGQQ